MNTITIDDITRPTGWAPVRRALDVRAFGVNVWTRAEGAQLVGEHTEERTGQDELYVLLAGRALFSVDGEEQELAPGGIVHVPAGARRAATALEDGTRILVVGRNADGAYREPAFETNAEVIALFGEDRVEEARDLLREADGRVDDSASIQYNLACCEARLGNPDDAFAHLERAIEGREDLARLAADDEDLVGIRRDPRFDALVGASATPG
jgi:quercetin dioxygenase-like cupin family protein